MQIAYSYGSTGPYLWHAIWGGMGDYCWGAGGAVGGVGSFAYVAWKTVRLGKSQYPMMPNRHPDRRRDSVEVTL